MALPNVCSAEQYTEQAGVFFDKFISLKGRIVPGLVMQWQAFGHGKALPGWAFFTEVGCKVVNVSSLATLPAGWQ